MQSNQSIKTYHKNVEIRQWKLKLYYKMINHNNFGKRHF